MSAAIKRFAAHLPPVSVTVIFLLTYSFFYFFTPPIMSDPDMPWHIAAGDLIRSLGALPHTDPWSYTAGDTVWYNLSWLWDVTLSITLQYVGMPGLHALCAIFLALTIAVLGYHLRSIGTLYNYPLYIGVISSASLFLASAYPRPQLVTYLLAALFHLIVFLARRGQYRLLFALPVLMIAWANSHGGILAAFTIFGAYGVEAIIYKEWRWLRALIIVTLTCALAMLINPYGIDIIPGTLRSLSSVITPFVDEWRAFTFGDVVFFTLWVVCFIFVANVWDKSIPVAEKILAYVWLFAALLSARHAPILGILAAPFLARSVQHRIGHLLTPPSAHPENPLLRLRMVLFTLVVLTISSISIVENALVGTHRQPAKDAIPMDVIEYLRDHPSTIRYFNHYDIGGYLIYYLNKPQLVFADGRAGTAYPETVLKDFISLYNLEKDWEKITEKYHIQGIIMLNGQSFDKFYENGAYRKSWKKVFTGKTASVFELNAAHK